MQNSWKNNYYSKITIFIVVIILLFQGLKLKRYSTNYIIRHDAISYYAYLPASLIYKDLSFEFISDLPDDFPGNFWIHTSPNGKQTLKMTMGVAVLNLPFFIISHLSAMVLKFDSNGYTAPYQLSILIAAITYLFLALLFLRKILLKYFNDKVVSITILLTVLATNLYYYTIVEPGMSHIYSFFLFSGFLYFTIIWYNEANWRNSILLGLFMGLIILVRPTNVIIALIFLLYGRYSIKSRVELIWNQKRKVLFMCFIAFLVVLPQFLYWKFSTGEWFYYSYGNEGFFFDNPQIIKGLFSYRKGWLIYTPVMIFSIIGFVALKKKIPELFFPILIYFMLNLYIVFSWWCWWYGGSFGARPLIETYAILSVPLAALINQIFNRGRIVKFVIITVLSFFIYLNLFQSRQYRLSQIHWDSMSKRLYWNVFLNEKWPDNYEDLIDPPDYEKAIQGKKAN